MKAQQEMLIEENEMLKSEIEEIKSLLRLDRTSIDKE